MYVKIRSEVVDAKPTLTNVLGKLYKTFIEELGQKWLIVVGDAKVFVLLQEIKSEYGSHLRWLLPFPGDWHILFNYQPALMKPYADAGLSKFAEVSGHQSETLTSLLQCKNFRRTHNFLIQAFETLYSFFLSLYLSSVPVSESSNPQQSPHTTEKKLQEDLSGLIQEFYGEKQ